jgi:hypothetical protein
MGTWPPRTPDFSKSMDHSDNVNSQVDVRSEVFTVVTMKNAVFWDVATCRSCVNRLSGGTYQSAATCSRWLLGRSFFYLEDGGDTFLRNVGSHKIYTRKQKYFDHVKIFIVYYTFK